jgi:hypothetical protein
MELKNYEWVTIGIPTVYMVKCVGIVNLLQDVHIVDSVVTKMVQLS